MLEWLAQSLERGDGTVGTAETSSDLPRDPSFSAPRAIAELALLTETIEELRSESPAAAVDEVGREALRRVIDKAIAHSLARDNDASDRVRKRLRLATDVTHVGAVASASGQERGARDVEDPLAQARGILAGP